MKKYCILVLGVVFSSYLVPEHFKWASFSRKPILQVKVDESPTKHFSLVSLSLVSNDKYGIYFCKSAMMWWPGFQFQKFQTWLRLELWTRLKPSIRNFQIWSFLDFTVAMLKFDFFVCGNRNSPLKFSTIENP
jgi:hypothetical protein